MPDLFEGLLHAAEVAHAVVDDGDHTRMERRRWGVASRRRPRPARLALEFERECSSILSTRGTNKGRSFAVSGQPHTAGD